MANNRIYEIVGINPNNEHVVCQISAKNKKEALNLYCKYHPDLAVVKIGCNRVLTHLEVNENE